MNTKYLQSLLMAVFLFTVVSTVQADSVGTVDWLEHNQRLLNETTIGKDLAKSDDAKVVYLFEQATKLLVKARAKYEAGQLEDAKVFSKASVQAIYAADRIMYNIPSTK